jgi:hypothetical protein
LTGTTVVLSGSLNSDTCVSGTSTVTGATTSMVAITSPITYPGDGFSWSAQVTSVNTVTVRICNTTNSNNKTLASTTLNVRVIQ